MLSLLTFKLFSHLCTTSYDYGFNDFVVFVILRNDFFVTSGGGGLSESLLRQRSAITETNEVKQIFGFAPAFIYICLLVLI